MLKAYNNLGLSLVNQGFPREAIECLKKALEINETDPYVLRNIAMAYHVISDFKNFIYYGEKALKRIEESYKTKLRDHLVTAYNNYGMFLISKGLYDEAIRNFTKSLKLESGNPVVLKNMISAYFRAKDYGKSYYYSKKLLEDDFNPDLLPDDPDFFVGVYLWGGKSAEYLGNQEQAISIYSMGLNETATVEGKQRIMRYLERVKEERPVSQRDRGD